MKNPIRPCIMLSSLLVLLFLNAGSASAYNYTSLEQSWLNSFGNTAPNSVSSLNAAPSSANLAGLPIMTRGLLAKAAPDECYDGIGSPYPAGPPCSQGKAKVNQAYVWGLTKSGSNIWFGTVANVLCLVMNSYLGTTAPMENTSWVCEQSSSASGTGDLRPPKIYLYNTTTGVLQNKTPADPRINATIGIRSAGNNGSLIILGGPGPLGINLFAYNNDNGAYLGSISIPAYNDIRRWITVNGILYTGVGRTAGGGRVLKWTGTVANPWQYEEVGNLDTPAAEIVSHEGRIFAATWPSTTSPGSLASLYMSPLVPTGGLTASHAAGWTRVWKANDYEPDPLVAATYAGGALASYQGYLYWGTMHVPFLATATAVKKHTSGGAFDIDPGGDGLGAEDILTTALGTHRAFSLFRGQNFQPGGNNIELLYGMQYLPVYDPAQKMYTFAFDAAHRNKMPNPVPKWGLSGFGNYFNAYAWSMAEYDNKLYIGTFDWSYVLSQGLLTAALGPLVDPQFLADLYVLQNQLSFPWFVWGADLYLIQGSSGPAIPADVSGLGNFTNYGIRNMVSASTLYVGTANPMNLLTDPASPLPMGGWELIGLTIEPHNVPTLNTWGFSVFAVVACLASLYHIRRRMRYQR